MLREVFLHQGGSGDGVTRDDGTTIRPWTAVAFPEGFDR